MFPNYILYFTPNDRVFLRKFVQLDENEKLIIINDCAKKNKMNSIFLNDALF